MTGGTRNTNNVIFGRFVDYVKHADCFSKMHLNETIAQCITAMESNTQAAKGGKTGLCK